jgi:diguanylate cyclase (GGDEF)-like protein
MSSWIAITSALTTWTVLVSVVSLQLGRRRAWTAVAQAQAAAHRDSLTGLLNRAGLEAAISPARPAMAVVLVDLDDFKHINDTLGHRAGDAVLAAIAQRLRAYTAPHGGIVARLGGDEFLALIPAGPTGVDLAVLGKALHRGLTAAPIDTVDDTLQVQASVGLSLLAPAADPIDTVDDTLQVQASVGLSLLAPAADPGEAIHSADRAMYEAKGSTAKVVVAEQAPAVAGSPQTARPGRRRRRSRPGGTIRPALSPAGAESRPQEVPAP